MIFFKSTIPATKITKAKNIMVSFFFFFSDTEPEETTCIPVKLYQRLMENTTGLDQRKKSLFLTKIQQKNKLWEKVFKSI